MIIRGSLRVLSLLLVLACGAVPQTREPNNVWRDLIKRPLTASNGGQYWAALKDALIPNGLAPYLQGSLMAITPAKAGTTRLLISMEGTDTADVTILLRGPMAKLKSEPRKGALVRFSGVVRTYTKEPFMVTFEVGTWGSGSLDFIEPR